MSKDSKPYVDGFVIPVPRSKLEDYRRMAEAAAAVWREHGALDFRETVLEDPSCQDLVSFPSLAGAKEDETVMFSWIVFESKQHRDEVNAKVMKDPRIDEMCDKDNMPFDCSRMAYGGFETLVSS